jgi:hypothetical protein
MLINGDEDDRCVTQPESHTPRALSTTKLGYSRGGDSLNPIGEARAIGER